MRRRFFRPATTALIKRHQLALLHIKLFLCHHRPFVKASLAERFAFVLFTELGALKLDYITHSGVFPIRYHLRGRQQRLSA